MSDPSLNCRLDYLDAVRAFALLLGFVFHACLSFVPIFIGWAVMDLSTGSVIPRFLLVSHSFRMELFFLIAGFFSHMSLHRKGVGTFIRSRLISIVIPFVAGWFILRPLLVSSWAMGGESMRGEVNILNGLKIGLLSLGELPKGLFTGTHLWFLYYLLLSTAIALSGRVILGLKSNLHAKATRWLDPVVAWIANSRFSWFALSLPTAVCLWPMRMWGMDTPDRSLVPHLRVLSVYGGFFALGWLLHRQEGLIGRFARLSPGRFALCILSVVATLALSGYESELGHPHRGLIRGGFAFTYAMMMWSLVALSIGLSKRFFNKPSGAVRYIADASYWLYLIHLPIVIWLQIAFAEVPFHWSLKLAAVSLLTLGISLVLYDLFIRSSLIGWTLSGRRRERVLFGGGWKRGASKPKPSI